VTYKTLLTERLRLEPIAEKHLPALVDIHTRNQKPFFGRMPRIFTNIADARAMLKLNDGMQRFVVITKGSKITLGAVTIANITGMPMSNATIGYAFDAAYSGNGFAREAVARVVAHGFKAIKIHRIEANIEPDNKRSIKLVKALGFRKEGVALRMLFLGDKWRDQCRFAITQEEWTR
jgi:[ribosomal protein S5]-alanine N-acetyltransferase